MQQHPVAPDPGTTSPAGATVTASGVHASIRRTASALAAATARPVPPPQARQHVEHRRVATGGRPPVDLHDRRALVAQRVGELVEAEVHGLDLGEHVGSRCHARLLILARCELEALVALVKNAPGLLGKRDLELVTRLDADLDGDDGALIAHEDGFFVTCGEAISPPFLQRRPVRRGQRRRGHERQSDIRAMGARPHGIVDMLVAPDKDFANQVLDGLNWAADTARRADPRRPPHARPPARAVGHRDRLHAARRCEPNAAKPGDTLLAAFALDGRYMSDANDFFTALRDRPKTSSEPTAKRWSKSPNAASRTPPATSRMPGIAGSLLQMIEGAGTGATLDLDAIPRPDEHARSSAGC